MNYTINEIPDEATDANSGDYMVMWQGKTKKVSILNLLKTLVKKSEVTNTVSTTSDNVITSKAVSSLLTISASNTTITNAPPLQNNATYRFFFTEQITGSDNTSALSISYNGTSYSVKATSNGSLKNFTAYPIATEQTRELKKGEKTEEEKGETKVETKGGTKSGTRATVTTYVYCQAYTTLEMMFDGTQFVIMGNPVVISNSDYTVYTDGTITYNKNYVDRCFDEKYRVYTDASPKYFLIGRTTKNDINQAFTNIQFQGGRVDGYYGYATLVIAQNSIIVGKSPINMSNIQITVVSNNDGKLEVYVHLDSYTYLNFEIARYSNFQFLFQEVQSITGTVLWQNQWS